MSENRKILLRNAFLGKFDRSQMKEVDNAIAIVKEAKAETEKALEVSNNQFNINYGPINGRCNLFLYSQSVDSLVSQKRKHLHVEKLKYYGTLNASLNYDV